MLETIREYGRECLEASGEADAIQRRHARFFLELAEQAEPHLKGADQEEWLAKLEAEQDNLRAALHWLEESQPEIALRMAGALGRFWHLHGYHPEGREALERVLERAPGAPGEVRAKALLWAGSMASAQEDVARAKDLLDRSLELSRALDYKVGVAGALGNLGHIVGWQGQHENEHEMARALGEESLAVSQEIGDRWGTAHALCNLAGIAMFRGDPEGAWPLGLESLAIAREIGDRRGIAWSLMVLGWAALDRGDEETALSMSLEGLAIFREIGNKPGMSSALSNLGMTALRQRNYRTARGFFEERMAIQRETGNRVGLTHSLSCLGDTAQALGDYEAAREYYEECRSICQEPGVRQMREMDWRRAWALHGIGSVASAQQDYVKARGFFEESLLLLRKLGQQQGMAKCLEGLAKVACGHQGQPERAVRLLAAAHALREAIGTPLSPDKQPEQEERLLALREALGDTAFAAAWDAGRALTWEQAVAEALEEPG
jgi:tetratricopeptide (TPR) repeat protein